MDRDTFRLAADLVRSARALVVTAGAGMGVDSGLPDFRGEEGFWRAYPPYQRLGLRFEEAASPVHFRRDPAFGWGFYGHRAHLYRETTPHQGFEIILRWAERLALDIFAVTSNVDGQFQKAGFTEDRVWEVHGSIHHLQCLQPCSKDMWENREEVPVDLETMRALRVPRCPRCGGVSRPNVLMFGDWSWLEERSMRQERRFSDFTSRRLTDPLVVIELGAGTAIPTIRHLSEDLGRRPGCRVVRINPRQPEIEPPHLALPLGALEALRGIDKALGRLSARPVHER